MSAFLEVKLAAVGRQQLGALFAAEEALLLKKWGRHLPQEPYKWPSLSHWWDTKPQWLTWQQLQLSQQPKLPVPHMLSHTDTSPAQGNKDTDHRTPASGFGLRYILHVRAAQMWKQTSST